MAEVPDAYKTPKRNHQPRSGPPSSSGRPQHGVTTTRSTPSTPRSGKKEICKHFLAGNCRYGVACFKKHSDSSTATTGKTPAPKELDILCSMGNVEEDAVSVKLPISSTLEDLTAAIRRKGMLQGLLNHDTPLKIKRYHMRRWMWILEDSDWEEAKQEAKGQSVFEIRVDLPGNTASVSEPTVPAPEGKSPSPKKQPTREFRLAEQVRFLHDHLTSTLESSNLLLDMQPTEFRGRIVTFVCDNLSLEVRSVQQQLAPKFVEILTWPALRQTTLQTHLDTFLSALLPTRFIVKDVWEHMENWAKSTDTSALVKKGCDLLREILHLRPGGFLEKLEIGQIEDVIKAFGKDTESEGAQYARLLLQDWKEKMERHRPNPGKVAPKPKKIHSRIPNAEDVPVDYKDIPVIPTEEELFVEEPRLMRPILETGPYKDDATYVDTLFKLMREDVVHDLREGLRYLRDGVQDRDKLSNIRTYPNVRFTDLSTGHSGAMFRIQLQPLKFALKWNQSKRLIFGSLVCLADENFQHIYLATVANRDILLLTNPKGPQIDIALAGNLPPNFMAETFTLIEASSAFWESYRPVLERLGKMDLQDLNTFAPYFVGCEVDIKSPAYLTDITHYNMEHALCTSQRVRVLKKQWPRGPKCTLDDSQLAALQAMLSKELSVIQGPPGTGKTYIGLQAIRILLENRETAGIKGPILVVTYTNHALDQFLEGVLKFEDDVVRIGSRTESEELKGYNLTELMKDRKGWPKALQREAARVHEQVDSLKRQIELIQKDLSAQYLSISRIREVADEAQFTSLWYCCPLLLTDKSRQVKYWLDGRDLNLETRFADMTLENPPVAATPPRATQKQPTRVTDQQPSTSEEPTDLEDDILADDEEHHRQQENNLFQEDGENAAFMALPEFQTAEGHADLESILSVQDVWSLDRQQRSALHQHWLQLYRIQVQDELVRLTQEYNKLCAELTRIRFEKQRIVLESKKVIGLTTTRAASNNALLQSLNIDVVIVEEAAEVLEAHVITALTKSTRHLILIGDHKQLRPSHAVYDLSVHYHLDLSLFERLIRNNIAFVTLSTQRRMRPEISTLLEPIYRETPLIDDVTTKDRDSIRGVLANVFYLAHRFPENKKDQESSSYKNEQEAELVARLVQYFIRQNYGVNQITVLTYYVGQQFALRAHLKRFKIENVRVTTVDRYQGEENDIVILSCVRGNLEGRLGHSGIDNRICVSISRARLGFYVVGNLTTFIRMPLEGERRRDTASHELWRAVIQQFGDAVGPKLVLQCKKHPETRAEVACAKDFVTLAPEGGCRLHCDERLLCGHKCERICHPDDHRKEDCKKMCTRVRPCKHVCVFPNQQQKRCCDECGPCEFEVSKPVPTCPRGHSNKVACKTNMTQHMCQSDCEELLSCGHHCSKKCGQKTHSRPEDCRELVEKLLPCGHKQRIPCNQEPEHARCFQPCEVPHPGCDHPCTGTCSDCEKGRFHKQCQHDCGRTLICGHQCSFPCIKDCPPCEDACQRSCVHSRCRLKCGTMCAPCAEPCQRGCQHTGQCTQLCGKPCDIPQCNEPCEKKLACGHQCLGLCGDPCLTECYICKPDARLVMFYVNDADPAEGEVDDRRYVQLSCGHAFEYRDLDRHVQIKTEKTDDKDRMLSFPGCPMCKKPIINTRRYESLSNEMLVMIDEVKLRIEQSHQELAAQATDLQRQIEQILDEEKKKKKKVQPKPDDEPTTAEEDIPPVQVELKRPEFVFAFLRHLLGDIKRASKERNFSRMQGCVGIFDILQSTLKTISEVYTMGLAVGTPVVAPFMDLSKLFNTGLTELSREDMELLHRLILLQVMVASVEIIQNSAVGGDPVCVDILRISGQRTPPTLGELNVLQERLNPVMQMCGLEGRKAYFQMLNKALGLPNGHWYTCKNGHMYVIGECGGAMQTSRCPDCREEIGGTNHALTSSNRHVGVDGEHMAPWGDARNAALGAQVLHQ